MPFFTFMTEEILKLDPLPSTEAAGWELEHLQKIDMLNLHLLDPYSPGGGYFLGINCVNSSTQDSPYCVRAGLSQYFLEISLFSRGISSHDEIDTWATLFHSFIWSGAGSNTPPLSVFSYFLLI